jgi:hypothetical protein
VRSRVFAARDLRSSNFMLIAWLGVAAFAGLAVGRGNLTLAFLPTILIGGLILFTELSLAGWCGLLLALTVGSRIVVALLGLPEFFDFMHYPAAFAFAIAAASRPPNAARLPAARWMTALLLLTALSSVANSTDPLRGLMFLLIIGEPILVIWAIQRWGVDDVALARVGKLAFIGFLIQIPLGLWQGSMGGWQDSVQGTMVEHGAGAHILGGLFALGLFIWFAGFFDGRHSLPTVVIVGVVAVGMVIAAGALQVALLGAASLSTIVFLQPGERFRRSGREGVRKRRNASRVAIAPALVVLALTAPFWVDFIPPGASSRAADLADPSQLEEVILAKERAREDPLQLIIGSGPGTSASRAALLITPKYAKPGSFLQELPLEPTTLAVEYSRKNKGGAFGGSAEQAYSSMLGVVGDLGMLGFLGLVLMFFGMYRASRRLGSWLAPAVGASLIMTFGLSFIDNWLEYPEFAVSLALLIGFATSGPPGGKTTSRTPSQEDREDREDWEVPSLADHRRA